MINEKIKELALMQNTLDGAVARKKEMETQFKESMKPTLDNIDMLSRKIEEIKKEIEPTLKEKFKEDKVKKLFGGLGIRETQVISYDESVALKWAKEKDMFVALDKKAFEKAVEGLNLDFVEIKKEPQVTYPKEYKIEE